MTIEQLEKGQNLLRKIEGIKAAIEIMNSLLYEAGKKKTTSTPHLRFNNETIYLDQSTTRNALQSEIDISTKNLQDAQAEFEAL